MNEKRKEIIQKMTEGIISGEIVEANNKLLSERELAKKFGESRLTVKEAIIVLEALGYVDIRDRQGVFVNESTLEQYKAPQILLGNTRLWPDQAMCHVMEIRQILEPPVTALSALRRSDEDVEKLKKCLAEMKHPLREGGVYNPRESTYWNSVFHSIIFNSIENTFMARVYESLLSISGGSVTNLREELPYPKAISRAESGYLQHESIAVAIEERDANKAYALAKEHLLITASEMVEAGRLAENVNIYHKIPL